jgi:DNA polymerase III sliding clamp (beta) subunit (PCNA family)
MSTITLPQKTRKKITFHPKFVVNSEGKRTEAIIPYKEFKELQKLLEDVADIICIEARRREKGIPLEEVKRELEKDGVL